MYFLSCTTTVVDTLLPRGARPNCSRPGRDRDQVGILDLDRLAGLVGGSADRGDLARGVADDVGGLAVRGDRYRCDPVTGLDRLAGRVCRGAERDDRPGVVADVAGLAV